MRRSLLVHALAWPVVSLALAGCGAHGATAVPVAHPTLTEASVTPVAVSDDAFASTVNRLLRDGTTGPARTALLAGAVERALDHATERFASGRPERGLATLTGALYLVRAGEVRREMLAKHDAAITAALELLAGRGDEGRSLALMTLRAAYLAPGTPARTELDGHLAALEQWRKDTRSGGPLEVAGHDERVLAARSLLEPTSEAVDAAREATIAWIERAVAFSQEARSNLARPKREETIEAFRAFRSGAETLAALSLRHGDANAALSDLERSSARRLIAPELYERIERAASGGDATAWRELLAALLSPPRSDARDDGGDPELAVDPDVKRAAVFGTALEAFRRDPKALESAMPLAMLLAELGMPEVSPLVLLDGVGAHPDPQATAAALGFVFQSLVREDAADDTASARRVFEAAQPLLALADRAELKGKLRPSPARIRLAMGTIEVKAGNLGAARPLLEQAASAEPSAEAWMTLASVERQAGDAPSALDHLARALALPEAKQDPFVAGEAHLATSDVLHDTGAADKAAVELRSALSAALDARSRARAPNGKARAERLLARVLERYGDAAGVRRATERAYAAAGDDRQQIAAIALDAAARALVYKDVATARAALGHALDAQLGDDDLVYVALWVELVEKATNTHPDGSASRALSSIKDEHRWPSRLASWGLGKLKDQDLVAAARTATQKTEAAFYTAVARRIAGDQSASDAALREVAKAPTIDLVEVRLAHDLLDAPKPPPGGVPAGVP